MNLSVNWTRSLATESYRDESATDSAMAARWETLRRRFREDSRTLGELESLANRRWIATRRSDPVDNYVCKDWNGLVAQRGMGIRKIELLIKLLEAVPE